ncbi:glycerol-3-phosphate dehydrogenase/oxidase [Actinospongicola halichondriae]|uniref:glycerol-3-phosphate dehydrogenase/oxidase n=1 Tax=Actinospongicola halichondriae TaxID=3236844 RepID=UPI003D5424BD
MSVGPFDRGTSLAALADQTFDVLVIGGGVTGAGVALDAASRGLRTALVEKGDFASGTSSKSSKLVHGGLRYLQQGDIRLVYEALRERQRLLRNAPHLVDVMPFLIPMFGKDGVIHPKLARALGSAMWMYDLTGGARIGKIHKRISADETMAHMPTLPPGRVAASYLYYDAQADDARLTMTIARTAAVLHGAVCVNHAPVVELLRRGVHVTGAVVEAHGRRIEVRARQVVNATGVWADEVRTLDEGRDPDSIRPAKGIHLTVPWSLVQNDIAVVAPVPKDKRSVFVVPWPAAPGQDPEFTYIGTTDTDYDGPLDDPQCTRDDVDYLLRAINHSTTTEITVDDVVGTWAGLRPLVKATPGSGGSGRTADLSRRHSVTASKSGMITVTGGKLTTYREMAADTVDAVADRLDLPRGQRKSRTKKLRLLGADGYDADASGRSGHLQHRFGGDTALIEAMIVRDPTLGESLVPGLPYLRAEAVYSARYEMAATLDDVLSRRTRALLLGRDATADVAGDVADLIGDELGWDEATRKSETTAFRAKAAQQRDPLELVD